MRLEAGSSLTAVLNATFVPAGKEVRLVGSCASFCDPRTYPTSQELEAFPAEMEVAVGLHPRHCVAPPQCGQSLVPERLRELVRSPRVRAFGEIGLDHSLPSQTWHWQMSALEELLGFVEACHVLVLYCRSMSEDKGTEAYMLLLRILWKRRVPQNQWICLHCFTGDHYVRDEWLAVFPNTYFSFTKRVARFEQYQVTALRGIPRDHLLLETDAPYFPLVPGERWSEPSQLYVVAESVATHLNTTPEGLLEESTTNAFRFFSQAAPMATLVGLNTAATHIVA
ncbi:3'-5' RNA nuclease TATDN2-like [Babylonia areolata]|uniref:3'-5' RNA nuclease TATDN2-like n=1 Tax=Babylonia areolata TaxID=304850 RepID=UPI003FD34397